MMIQRRDSGFTMVELLIVVVISALALTAIYQSLITQQRTYAYQTGAIDTQGTTRMALQVIASELREVSASAGEAPLATGGSDLLVATADSIRFRAFGKAGIVCRVDPGSPPGYVDVWVPGQEFVVGDSVFLFVEGDPESDEDDSWITTQLQTVQDEASSSTCEDEWAYDTQSLRSLPSTSLLDVDKGAMVRSFDVVTYKSFTHDGQRVLGRRLNLGEMVPLVGPLAGDDGLGFRYFDAGGNELTAPTTQAQLADVARVFVSVKAISPGAGAGNQPLVDSLSTNVYLRGN